MMMRSSSRSRGLCRCRAVLLALASARLAHLASGFGITRFSSPPLSLPPPSERPPESDPVAERPRTASPAATRDGSGRRRRDYDSRWTEARKTLRDPRCCVVTVCALDPSAGTGDAVDDHNPNDDNDKPQITLAAHLAVLQDRLVAGGPSDIDMRARIDTTTMHSAMEDCLQVCRAVLLEDGKVTGAATIDGEADSDAADASRLRPSARALAEFAMGMASFAEDCRCPDDGVFLRLVCASSYQARDPVFHTDKAPLRGYATLAGAGTEFVARPCSPPEYAALRTLGAPLRSGGRASLRRAAEREFIVMKGDHYHRADPAAPASWWRRACACVHRSPPGSDGGGRRVIVSFDLADGDDDREWCDARQKRKWRAGMTQRKSRLVA